ASRSLLKSDRFSAAGPSRLCQTREQEETVPGRDQERLTKRSLETPHHASRAPPRLHQGPGMAKKKTASKVASRKQPPQGRGKSLPSPSARPIQVRHLDQAPTFVKPKRIHP